MSKVAVICAHCGETSLKEAGGVNRSIQKGAPLYCDRTCSGAAKRVFRSDSEKRAAKAAYDAEYRERNLAELKAKKARYYAENVDRDKEREARKRRMPQHVEYCRRPEYKAYKQGYDRRYRAEKYYGPFAEAFMALLDVESEIASRASRYEIYQQNGTLNKSLQRKRDYGTRSIPETVRSHAQERAVGNPPSDQAGLDPASRR